ncbi:MAG TPA: ATP-dependent DNA helicase DinG [Rhodanobacteraceae bacterium]
MLADATKDAIRAAYAKLKEQLPGYRVRAAQGRMIATVANTFAEGGNAVIEAPTGTGKSMAYLIAAVDVARALDKKLVIATATVALQEQLVNQDIPRYLAMNGLTLRVALAKGRGRYLCPRNLNQAMGSFDDTQMGLGFDADLALWAKAPGERDKSALAKLDETFSHKEWDGDLDSAPVAISPAVRQMVTTTAGGCTNRKCAFFMQCPFYTARRKVDDADIIVANHDLVLADLAMPGEDGGYGGIILPKPEATFYVFDEGHHLPAKAIDRGATHVHLGATRRHLGRLSRQALAAYSLTDKERLGRYDPDTAEAKLQELIDALQAIENAIALTWTPDPAEREPVYRASLGQLPEDWVIHARALATQTVDIQRWLMAVQRAVSEMTEGGPTRDALLRELGIAMERIETQVGTWIAWAGSTTDVGDDAPPGARWVSRTEDNQFICHASAVSAAPLLKRVLWGNAAGVVVTSATLSVGGNFRDFADAIGLPDDAQTQSLPSPFDLARQARLEVPAVSAMPNEREAHAQAISDWLDAHLDWDAGNLVLFTSRAKLERVLQLLPIARVRRVRAQGARAKGELIAAHVKDIEAGHGSTLFGLASFGEGLDLPGKLCETVVVTQIPFAVPTDPVGATYAEWLESCGRNPFFEVTVPQATRLLTQYCGRLIRSEDDRGRIVLLDRRIVAKRYGTNMLRALPPFERIVETAH